LDNESLVADPKKRLNNIRKKRSILINNIKTHTHKEILNGNSSYYSQKIFFDEPITMNPFCVVRVLGTAHSTTKFISTKLSLVSIQQPIKELMKKISFIGEEAFRIPELREMTKEDFPRSRLNTKGVDVIKASSALKPLNNFYWTNKVLGTNNNYIPVMIYHEKQNYLSEVKKLQSKHFLGRIRILTLEGKVYVVSTKIMQYNQLNKLLSTTKCVNKNVFSKYRSIYVPINAELKEELEGLLKGSMSKSHEKIFDNEQEGLFSGDNKIKITKKKRTPIINNGN
jgi:hypothetical protein